MVIALAAAAATGVAGVGIGYLLAKKNTDAPTPCAPAESKAVSKAGLTNNNKNNKNNKQQQQQQHTNNNKQDSSTGRSYRLTSVPRSRQGQTS
jgi:hypothetical protein